MLACQHALGWKDILYRRSNTGSTRPCHLAWSSLDTAIIRELQAANRLDQRLYEYANQLLDEHITQVPDFYRRLAAFQEENRRHQLRASSGRRPDGTVKRLVAQVRGMLRLSR